jgi:hypothetical protein
MQRQYKADGLVAISVSLDDVNDPEAIERVRKFLRAQDAAFQNFVLDEKPEVWQEKLRFDGPPCVFVFNQQGGIAKQFKNEFTYADVEKLVKQLLGKK